MKGKIKENELLLSEANYKIEKFTAKKLQAEKLANNLEKLGLKNRAIKVKECGSLLSFGKLDNGKNRLIGANFCKDRLCPMCAWRKSSSDFFILSKALDNLLSDKSLRAIFLTLTIKNCNGNSLKKVLDDMSEAWNRLNSTLKKKGFVLGYYKATEITYNKESSTFHPHYHLVIIVKETYFYSKDYMPQIKWRKLWKQSLRLDYAPLVNIQAVDSGENQSKAVLEVSKYAVKSSDYIDDLKALSYLSWAVTNKRFIASGGLIKIALIDVKEKALIELRASVYTAITHFQWFSGIRAYKEIKDI